MSFATATELATFTGDSTLDGTRGELLVDSVSAVIRTHCRQTFDLVEDDEVELRGSCSHRLKLPERPVVSVASVLVNDVAVTSYRLVRDTLIRTAGLEGVRDWGGPSYVVTVTYTHGFAADSPAMATLKGVCLQAAARAAVNPQSMTSESIGDWSASWSGGGGGFALTAAEQSILDRFKHEQAS